MRPYLSSPRVMQVVAGLAAILTCSPRRATAQVTSAFTACSTGALANCSIIQLTSQLGVGTDGFNLFEIAVHNSGSSATPSLATSIYNLVFGTGQSAAPGDEVEAAVTPASVGAATIADNSTWDVFDSGDAIFLSALTNNGVGGCVGASPEGGFGLAGQTCDPGAFLTFSFFTPRAYDPTAMSLLDLEIVGLGDQLSADSCGGPSPCAVTPSTPVTTTPEPGALLLSATGLFGLIGFRVRRRTRGNASPNKLLRGLDALDAPGSWRGCLPAED